MKQVLLTGSRGFIGRHLVAAIKGRWPDVELDGIEPPGDARSLAVDDDLPHYDLAIHCAAVVGGRENMEGRAAFLAAMNLQLDGAFFEWALRAKPGRIVFLSSSAVYPIGAPDGAYGAVKAMGEQVAELVREAGVPVTVVRPFSVYGEDQAVTFPFAAFVQRALKADQFELWGDGSQTRDFIHVDDVAEAILELAVGSVDGPVDIGTGRPTTMLDLATSILDAVGRPDEVVRCLLDKPHGVPYRVAYPDPLFEHFEPRVTLEEGITRAIEAAQ